MIILTAFHDIIFILSNYLKEYVREKWPVRNWALRLVRNEISVDGAQKMKREKTLPSDVPCDKRLRKCRRDMRPNCYSLEKIPLISNEKTADTAKVKKKVAESEGTVKSMQDVGDDPTEVLEFLAKQRKLLKKIRANKVKDTWV